MSLKGVIFAVWAGVCGAGMALAQPSTLSDPAELPPKSFTGQQYVDSRGCVYLRAGFGGEVTWVPRVTADRKQMCSPPSGLLETAASIAGDVAVVPIPPAPVVKKPAVVKPKKPRKVSAPPPTPPGMRMACPAATPYLEQLRGPSGDSKLYCTRGDGTVEGATLPRLIHAGKVVGQVADVTIASATASVPPVPKGYVRAWKDDRLNPKRAVGTPQGMAAQDRVWTRDVPHRAVKPGAGVAVVGVPVVAATGRHYVQVGSFAVDANADGAADLLGARGLPVSRAAARLGGKAVTIVYAGPFATLSEAQGALAVARRAGFADAFVRR